MTNELARRCRRRLPGALIAFSVVTSLVHDARAQAPAPAPGPTAPSAVVPPVLKSTPAVPYPDGATGDADVIVTLVVGADGKVREVKHADGTAPFADAARSAVLGWLYEPATRDGQPVAATIRVLVHFAAPKVVTAPATVDAPEPDTPSVVAPPAAPNEPETVRVRGDRAPAPQSITMSMAEVRQLPGAFGDPFRALEVLPGVVPTISGLPFYYIRGAPPSNIGYYFDGVRVPYLFHFVFGPSVIHPMMVDRVDLYSGAFPAQFGRYAGGIVSAETAAPRDKFVHASVRLIDAGALAETGLLDNKLHVLLGGRYSWIAALASAISQDGSGDYRDYQARLTYDFSPKTRLTVFSFGGSDYVTQEEKNQTTRETETNVIAAGEFHRIDTRLDYIDGDRTKARAGLTFGLDRSRLEGNRFVLDYMLQGRGHVEHRITPEVLVRTGLDITTDTYDATLSRYSITPREERETAAFYKSRFDYILSAYGDLKFRFGKRLELTPGVRTDFWGASGASEVSVDPRLAGLVDVTKDVRLVFAHGMAHQRPAFPVPAPAISIPGIPGGLQRILQTSGGVEVDLPWDVALTASVWKNSFQNFNDFVPTDNGSPFDIATSRPRGYAYGFEFMARRRLSKRVGGIVSYTLSRNVRQLASTPQPSIFDRTHVLNAAVSVDLGRNWRFGTRFLLYTGWPSVNTTSGRGLGPTGSASRLPAFFRFDARLEKKWIWKSGLWISLVFEGLNVTGSTETISQECGVAGCRQNNLGPIIIPAIGVEGGISMPTNLRTHLVLALSILGASACIPSDTAAKGGVAVTVVPSAATKSGTFTTLDGWDVTITAANIGLEATLTGCTGGSASDEYGASGRAYIKASIGGLIEIRGSKPSRTCNLQVVPNRYYGDEFDQPPAQTRLRGSARKRTGANTGATVRFDLTLESGYSSDKLPKRSVTIPPGDKTDAAVELAIEALFRPDAGSSAAMDALAAADTDGDGIVSMEEFESFLPPETPNVPLSMILAERLATQALRFLP